MASLLKFCHWPQPWAPHTNMTPNFTQLVIDTCGPKTQSADWSRSSPRWWDIFMTSQEKLIWHTRGMASRREVLERDWQKSGPSQTGRGTRCTDCLTLLVWNLSLQKLPTTSNPKIQTTPQHPPPFLVPFGHPNAPWRKPGRHHYPRQAWRLRNLYARHHPRSLNTEANSKRNIRYLASEQ